MVVGCVLVAVAVGICWLGWLYWCCDCGLWLIVLVLHVFLFFGLVCLMSALVAWFGF